MREQRDEWIDLFKMIVATMVVVGAGKALLEIPWLASAAAALGFISYGVHKWLGHAQKSPQQLN